MGVKRGEFYTNDGDCISVSFAGQNISAGSLTFAPSPVIIQMDGGQREYKPVQYATASITCISSSIELLELCVQNPLEVAVEVKNKTQNAVLFAGYVTPNTLSQPIDDVNCAITIECADWLGISQYVKYAQINRDKLSTLTVREAVLHCMRLITDMATIYMSDHITLGSEIGNTRNYPELRMSEAVFFSDPTAPEVEDTGILSISRKAVTCYEAMAILAESFRATWVQSGCRVSLVDDIGMLAGSPQYFLLADSAVDVQRYTHGGTIEVGKDSFASGGNTVSVLQEYSLFSLRRSRNDLSLMPDIFAFNNLLARGKRIRDSFKVENSFATVTLAQLLASRLVTFSNAYADNLPNPEASEPKTFNPSAAFVARKDVETFVPINEMAGEMLVNWDSEWDNYLRIYKSGTLSAGETAPDSHEFVQVNIDSRFLVPTVQCRYLSLQLNVEAGQYILDSYDGLAWFHEPSKDVANLLVRTRIKCGEHYYNFESGQWVTDEVWGYLNISEHGKEWKRSVFATEGLPPGIIAGETCDGVVQLTFRFYSNGTAKPSVQYFRKLELKLVPSVSAKSALYNFPIKDVERKRVNNYDNEYGEVELPITFGFPASTHIFSPIVQGVEYVTRQSLGGSPESYRFLGEMLFNTEGAQYAMLERIQRLASYGDRKEYALCLKDSRNSISPFDTFTSALWQGNKIVVAYQKDIEKNIINVTLN